MDIIHVNTDVEIVKEETECQAGKQQLVFQPTRCSAYCRLMIAPNNFERTEVSPEALFGKDNIKEVDGHFYVHNEYLLAFAREFAKEKLFEVHGPALKMTEAHGTRQEDLVLAFECRHIVKDIKIWTARVKDLNWPSADIQDYVNTAPTFLVPVGHKQSTNAGLEYRISTSFSERKLMFNLNMTQIRCLILLKMLMKTYIKSGAMKSYFCKTALFHTIEQTLNKGWVEDNLVLCVIRSLRWLVDSLNRNDMRHYFLPSLDMLEGRFDKRQLSELADTLTTIMDNCAHAILGIHLDQVATRLYTKLFSHMEREQVVSLRQPEKIQMDIGSFLLDGHLKYYRFLVPRLLKQLVSKKHSTEEMITQLERYIHICENSYRETYQGVYATVGNLFKKRFCSEIGSLLAVVDMENDGHLSDQTKTYLTTGKESDAACGKLKCASVLYRCQQYVEVKAILDTIDDLSLSSNDDIAAICGCSDIKCEYPKGFLKHWQYMMSTETVDNYVAWCVYVIHRDTIPSEFSRLQTNIPISIDPLPYYYGLQFLTYRHLDNGFDDAESALVKLVMCVQQGVLHHNDTSVLLRDICLDIKKSQES